MSLVDQINNDVKEAMKAKDKEKLAALRAVKSALLLAATEKGADGGVSEEGRPYIAMEFIDGTPITTYCDEQRLTIPQRIALLLAVCDGVSYAHRNLVVHRDLKPSNILVDKLGQPKLLDFGIAKILSNESTSETQTMQRVLTPDYAAPEQFVGGAVTTSVDVYALGSLLFELLSGSRPYARVAGSPLDLERWKKIHVS